MGVLALQGDFGAHGRVFEKLGVPWQEVRTAQEFEGIDGLVIPGGESSTLLQLLDEACRESIEGMAQRGCAIYGTCAGAILLARQVANPPQASLDLLDVVVVRNGYGRQAESFVVRQGDPEVDGEEVPKEMVFIRATLFEELGPKVRVLARVKGAPVYVQQGNLLASTFHPELSSDPAVHLRFLETAGWTGTR